MRLPSSLRIAGATWRVVTVPELFDDDGTALEGTCDPTSYIISICRTVPAKRRWEVLIHELMHACFSMSTLELGEEQEEIVVSRITPFLFSALADNGYL